jgi:hypothetical protein
MSSWGAWGGRESGIGQVYPELCEWSVCIIGQPAASTYGESEDKPDPRSSLVLAQEPRWTGPSTRK